MTSMFQNLTIGKKIGAAFAVLGLLFILVVVRYQGALTGSSAQYEQVLNQSVALQLSATSAGGALGEARMFEEQFLATRSQSAAEAVRKQAAVVLKEAETMESLARSMDDGAGVSGAAQIRDSIGAYVAAFDGVEKAWQAMGLDANSGMQGTFRTAAVEVATVLNDFDTAMLKNLSLQLRKAEKNFRIELDESYVDTYTDLKKSFLAKLESSSLNDQLKQDLQKTLKVYSDAFGELVAEEMGGVEVSQESIDALDNSAAAVEKVLDSNYVDNIWRDFLEMRQQEKIYLLEQSAESVAKLKGFADNMRASVDGSQVKMDKKEGILKALETYQNAFAALVEKQGELEALTARMRDAANEITPVVAARISETERFKNVSVEEAKSEVESTASSSLIISVIILVMGALFVFLISRSISTPMTQFQAFIRRIEQGNLTVHCAIRTRDELGSMSEGLNSAMDNLRHSIRRVKDAGVSVGDGSQSLTDASSRMSQGATEQAASIEETSSAMEEMVSNIQQNTENAHITEGMSKKASADAVESGKAVNEAVTALKEIADKIGII
ncbi:MAG: methyl-accepting chemotaxis protein, partial [Magnetococcales bacterium]|nr:methyl-accepting chemotaxis protein [Magnetococcales bacterium]